MDIIDFTTFLETEKRYSAHTLKAYTIDLNQFTHFISLKFEVAEPKDISFVMIREWISSLKEQQLDNSSINRKVSTLHSYFNFLHGTGRISFNPSEKIHTLKTKTRITVFVPQTDMEYFRETVNENTFVELRNKVIIEVFYQSGIRLSELMNLKDSEIDLHSLTFKVTGKRNKQRILPFHHSMKHLLTKYLEQKNKLYPYCQFLICNRNGKKASPQSLYNIVGKELSKVTTVTKKSPHVLRHTFATHMLNNGASLIAIKELLGHSSLAATQIYTHNTIEQLKSIHKQAHPMG
ncbi:MAG: tyrosine-type recombinase/integrase [Bacteroidales bacterium]|nr:tyrosine-type recombinase/integrase [Bacteroidales bacterium]